MSVILPPNNPATNPSWFNPVTKKFEHFEDGAWVETPITFDAELADALATRADIDHSHPTHGDINFTGIVSADEEAGLTGTRTISGYTLTFKKGLLVGFQAP